MAPHAALPLGFCRRGNGVVESVFLRRGNLGGDRLLATQTGGSAVGLPFQHGSAVVSVLSPMHIPVARVAKLDRAVGCAVVLSLGDLLACAVARWGAGRQ